MQVHCTGYKPRSRESDLEHQQRFSLRLVCMQQWSPPERFFLGVWCLGCVYVAGSRKELPSTRKMLTSSSVCFTHFKWGPVKSKAPHTSLNFSGSFGRIKGCVQQWWGFCLFCLNRGPLDQMLSEKLWCKSPTVCASPTNSARGCKEPAAINCCLINHQLDQHIHISIQI